MPWIKCPNPRCRFSWESRVESPKRCPRCSDRLDIVRRRRNLPRTEPAVSGRDDNGGEVKLS